MSVTAALREGKVDPGDEVGTVLGFTSDRFFGWLWVKDGAVYISFIASLQPGKGHLRELFASIRAAGYAVKVPTPLAQMEAILTRWGFTPAMENDPYMGYTEVWKEETPTA